jgi:CRP/FNR family transcriptional regulator, cyclic AMP receptor protein
MASILDHCKGLPQRRLAPGDTIIEEGRRGGVMFILADGAAEVLKGDVSITTVCEPGALFGEMAILLGTPNTATVRAAEPSTFYVVDDPATFLTAPDIMLGVSRLLAKRLQMVTTYLADLQHQFAEREDHLGMVDEVLESLLHHQDDED